MWVHDASNTKTLGLLREQSKAFEKGGSQDILIDDFVLAEFVTEKTKSCLLEK
jgi:hypothetical protein